MMSNDPLRIGQLRYMVTISKRTDTPDPAGPGMIETLTNIVDVPADIVPTGPMTYFGSINADADKPITHRIFTRWITTFDPDFDLNYQITRTLNTPDSHTRTETFRVWRVMEIDGRQRFLQFDAELESVKLT